MLQDAVIFGEVLAGEHRYSYTLDPRTDLLYQGRSSSLSMQLWGEHKENSVKRRDTPLANRSLESTLAKGR